MINDILLKKIMIGRIFTCIVIIFQCPVFADWGTKSNDWNKDGFIKIQGVINRFNIMILFSSIALIIFLYFFTSNTNFMNFNQPQRFLFLVIEITISIFIYFSVSKLIYKKPLKTLFN